MLFEKTTFEMRRVREPVVIERHEFVGCTFDNCSLGPVDREKRSYVRNVKAKNTTIRSCWLDRTILEEVVVDGLKTSGVQFVRSCACKHVVIEGRVGRLVLRNELEDDGGWLTGYYADVDWAIDISRAIAQELEIDNIPADLVKRDPETQAVIRRANVERADWQKVAKGLTTVIIKDMLRSGDDARLLVAPKGNKKNFHRVLDEIRALRDAGIADLE